MIEFVTCYGWKTHEHLVCKGRALKILYIGPLSGASNQWDNKRQISNECRSKLQIVVTLLKYIMFYYPILCSRLRLLLIFIQKTMYSIIWGS